MSAGAAGGQRSLAVPDGARHFGRRRCVGLHNSTDVLALLMRLARLHDGRRIALRPVAPDDADRVQAFVRSLSPGTRYRRFLGVVCELGPEALSRLTRVDYERTLTLVAHASDKPTTPINGIAEYVADHDAQSCEFAIVVHDDWQSCGLGTLLLEGLKESAASASLKHMRADVLAENRPMLRLARSCGFTVGPSPDGDYLLRVQASLARRRQDWFDHLCTLWRE